jgi:osmotically inducible lipoprotein OsmB
MIQAVKKRNILALLLAIAFIVLSIAPDSFAHRRPYRHKHSKTKHIAIGTAAGAIGGALIGGKKGALIGAGAGAGTGYLVYRHKKRTSRRH